MSPSNPSITFSLEKQYLTLAYVADARDKDNAKDQSKQKAPSFGGTRLLISGIVKRLSENFLKTFLKRVGAADVLSLQMNRNRDKALFVIANENVGEFYTAACVRV